jgi:hypothetical protein
VPEQSDQSETLFFNPWSIEMRLTVTNEGENPVRVIVDRDNVNDSTLEANETESYETAPEGVIEFRELGGPQGDLSGGLEST